jgi:hypothetical protein
MSKELLAQFIFFGGVGQLGILVASALVPFRLNWKTELGSLSRLHRQMYWVYGGYVVLSIVAFALISLFNSVELAGGGRLARSVCLYVAVFWGCRVVLQTVFDVKSYLAVWWLKVGYHGLTVMFTYFVFVYGFAALM